MLDGGGTILTPRESFDEPDIVFRNNILFGYHFYRIELDLSSDALTPLCTRYIEHHRLGKHRDAGTRRIPPTAEHILNIHHTTQNDASRVVKHLGS